MGQINSFLNVITGILGMISTILVSLATIFGGLLTFSKKFRKWFNDKIRNTEEIKEIGLELKEISGKIKAFDSRLDCIEQGQKEIKKAVEKDKTTTLLTLKYEILDICNRAKRFGGIITEDKALLNEMYEQYVDVWKQNHYIKTLANDILENYPILSEYERVK